MTELYDPNDIAAGAGLCTGCGFYSNFSGICLLVKFRQGLMTREEIKEKFPKDVWSGDPILPNCPKGFRPGVQRGKEYIKSPTPWMFRVKI